MLIWMLFGVIFILALVQWRCDRVFLKRLHAVDEAQAAYFDRSFLESSIALQNEYRRFLKERKYRTEYNDDELRRLGDQLMLMNRVYLVVFALIFVSLFSYFVVSGI